MNHAATGPAEGALLGRPARLAADADEARAILGAWQSASFRGYLVVEKRAERRLVVLTLIANLRAESLLVHGLIVAADELARDQWQQLLVRDGNALEGWTVQTAQEILAHGGVVDPGCVVLADELDAYLTEDFAAALTGSRALLGLCSSPGALGEALHLRRYVGNVLKLEKSIPSLDFQQLLENQRRDELARDENDPEEPREQVLTATNLENLLGRYLSAIQKLPLLTADEEIDLAKRIEAGLYATQKLSELIAKGQKPPVQQRREMQWICRDGDRAKNRFLEGNLRLVYQIARKYSRRMEIMDVIQEGNLGLIRAVEKFDYTKGFKFSTYATWWIRQAITRAIPDQAYLIRIPVHVYESDRPILKEWTSRLESGEDSSVRAIAAELRRDPDDVEAAILRDKPAYSLEMLADRAIDLKPDDDIDLIDEMVYELLQDQLQSILETLSEREAGVIRLRFGLIDDVPRTLDEIGQVYGVTRERIRQIERDAMEKLRHPSRSQVLSAYLFDDDSRRRPTRDQSDDDPLGDSVTEVL